MPITAVIGVHWGDEGKGKVIDYLVEKGYDAVARFNGGPNAGHTIYPNGQKVVLHVVPSGISYPHVTNIIGNGVALDPQLLLGELTDVRNAGADLLNLYISDRCKVITPYHKEAEKQSPINRKIGTTGKGMGSVYSSHTARITPLLSDFLRSHEHVTALLRELDEELGVSEKLRAEGHDALDASKIADDYRRMIDQFSNNVTDTTYKISNMLRAGSKIIAEGAQASLLDKDHGTYPFVTSSNSFAGGISPGLGVPPNTITETVGVMKAGYITRVGGGPFPTELGNEATLKEEEAAIKANGKIKRDSTYFRDLESAAKKGYLLPKEMGQYLRIVGDEFGSTTKRPRRTGWPDLVATQYSDMLNGFTCLALTKLDV
ncbi:MAG TPA: adenylosuccinate synthetase, partial [archaeon]|nr:adenylosuccinate synthetase [archaeon]